MCAFCPTAFADSEDTASLTELVSCQFARGAAAEVNCLQQLVKIQTNTHTKKTFICDIVTEVLY